MGFKLAYQPAPDVAAVMPADAPMPAAPSLSGLDPITAIAVAAALGAQVSRQMDAQPQVPRAVWLQRPWPQWANPPVPLPRPQPPPQPVHPPAPSHMDMDAYAITQDVLRRSERQRSPADYIRTLGADPAIRQAATMAALPTLLSSDAFGDPAAGQTATHVLQSLSAPLHPRSRA